MSRRPMPRLNSTTNERCVFLPNPHIQEMEEDVLYHLALSTAQHDLKAMFGDIKFVVVGGSPRRMEAFAHFMVDEIQEKLPTGQTLTNIAGKTDRYVLFKVGPVLICSHGIGRGSFSIMMTEIFKILHYADIDSDVRLFRIGTSGGLGIPAGSVVVTESCVDGLFRPYLEMAILGKVVKRESSLDDELIKDLMECKTKSSEYLLVKGKTMCTLDFYEGQARLDGAFCDYNEKDKFEFLKSAHQQGICNIEMESLCFAAMCHHAKIKGSVVCVTLLDRMQGDQVNIPHNLMQEYDQRPASIVSTYIKKKLGIPCKN